MSDTSTQVRSAFQIWEDHREQSPVVIPVRHMGDSYDGEIATKLRERIRLSGRAVTVSVVGAGWLKVEAA